MAATTFFYDHEVEAALSAERDLGEGRAEVLREVRKRTGREWIVVRHVREWRTVVLGRRKEQVVHSLYLWAADNEWQHMGAAGSTLRMIDAYLYGVLAGVRQAKR